MRTNFIHIIHSKFNNISTNLWTFILSILLIVGVGNKGWGQCTATGNYDPFTKITEVKTSGGTNGATNFDDSPPINSLNTNRTSVVAKRSAGDVLTVAVSTNNNNPVFTRIFINWTGTSNWTEYGPNTSASGERIITINVPNGQAVGTYRMRVMCWSDFGGNSSATGCVENSQYGAGGTIVDYTVEIIEPVSEDPIDPDELTLISLTTNPDPICRDESGEIKVTVKNTSEEDIIGENYVVEYSWDNVNWSSAGTITNLNDGDNEVITFTATPSNAGSNVPLLIRVKDGNEELAYKQFSVTVKNCDEAALD